MEVNNRLEQLRSKMKAMGIDAYMIPSADPHISEYVADYYKCRTYFSGFTGSAGTLIVTLESALLWADGRYFIQAERELKGSGIELMKMAQPNVPTITEWINSASNDDYVVGYNGQLFSYAGMERFKKNITNNHIQFKATEDIFNEIWSDRPALPQDKIFEHPIEFTGQTVGDKIANVRSKMAKDFVDYYMLSSLNDIAWLFNIRGNDVAYTPVIYAYAFINKDEALLFVDENKVPNAIKNNLEEQGVTLKAYADFYNYLIDVEGNKRIAIDVEKVNEGMINHLSDTVELVKIKDYVLMTKACMNEVEIKNYKNCQVKDGVAMVKFLYWLDKTDDKSELTENAVADKLETFRQEQQEFIELSFETISAYGSNGAMMHYSVSHENPVNLDNKSFYLVDSGGQYYDGTTDITRTVALGELSEEEKKDYTLVLKGNIALSKTIFLEGTRGPQLDVLARHAIWQQKMDYKCGTGHGIGYLLGVHEGPQRFTPMINETVLKPGMVITNEPGIYKEGQYGIRLENILLVNKLEENEMGNFLNFEPLTLCPFDPKAIDASILTEDEIGWLNDYHEMVYEKLKDGLDQEEREWLREVTERIVR